MKIAIVGGGPAGLFFAYLMKKDRPACEVTVFEQNPADATYGWGVVFSDVALGFLREADPAFNARFVQHHERCDYMEVIHRGMHVQLRNNHFSRTSRIDLLQVLHEACAGVGVELRFEHRFESVESLSGFDLIVGADGANSAIRTELRDAFRPTFEQRRNRFAWYGTAQLFHPVSLIFRDTPAGVFIAHAYQYSPSLSTFLVETDPGTWRRAGLDRMEDEASRRYCEDVFRPELGANRLLSNRSTWFQATIVSNERWHSKNIVLLGDALRTVHFSLGSGTRMAMQDAIALHRAVQAHGGDLPAAFAAFEAERRPASASFQSAASRSLDWYEQVAGKMDLDPVEFAYDYMRRTGRVTDEHLRERDPGFMAAVHERRGPSLAPA